METDIMDELEERAEAIGTTIEFLYGDITENDGSAIRAMLVLGGNDDQIVRSFAVAALNQRVERDSKSRYAAGVLRNLMLEDGNLPTEADEDGDFDWQVNG